MDYFNDDFRDFLRAVNSNKADYTLVGGMAVILHGYVRSTGDMDIWVRRMKNNYDKLSRAFKEFGMSVLDMTDQAF